jgi:hypothetical protein
MQQQQLLHIIKHPLAIEQLHIVELEKITKEFPFFETAHLLYTKGLHKYQALNYSKQLRKTAIIANSRGVLYELLHTKQSEETSAKDKNDVLIENAQITDAKENKTQQTEEKLKNTVSITNTDVKVIYINTVSNQNTSILNPEKLHENTLNKELEIVKIIENDTVVENEENDEIDEKTNTFSLEQEISKGIVQSYVETDIIKTPQLNEKKEEPSSFTEWLKAVQNDNHTFQINTASENPEKTQNESEHSENEAVENKANTSVSKNRQIIDKIIEFDPGRIKIDDAKFYTPSVDAKQSLLENEHLVTETLANIYALQGNNSKAIRAYEILSLKFPQKSVYFASLINKLKKKK